MKLAAKFIRDFCNYTELADFSGKIINLDNLSTHLEKVSYLQVFQLKVL